MKVELVRDVTRLEAIRGQWDGLAVERARPFCAPAWMLAWWRHAAPADARLSVVVVLEGDELVGVGPFFSVGGRIRLLAVEASLGLEPLAREGREREVGRAIAEALPDATLVQLEGLLAEAGWPELLRFEAGAWVHRELEMPSPTLRLEGRTFDEWVASKTSHFRNQARRGRKRLEEGGSLRFRLAETESELERGLAAFADLHRARWQPRGGSGVLTPEVERMLPDVARELAPGRFRLWTVEVDERIVAADIWLAAGGEVSWWLSGFDPGWGRANPTLQSLLAALEHGWAAGDRRFDFGGGEQEVKSRLADGADTLEWSLVVPRRPGYARARLALAPRQLRRAATRHLPAGAKARIKKLLRRA